MKQLKAKAKELGVAVYETNKLRGDLNAIYMHDDRVILLRDDLDPYTKRSALAHEIGHARYGDEHSDDPRLERRADLWAAQLVISEPAYREAEQDYGPHPGALAWALGVTRDVVDTWRTLTLKRREAS
ncbi:ImmA/IrrE family metallo-endopeptidase [Corynebacterium sp. AOP12-C2-36]|uniref:ImmA/IrrE family metallo-endopeptidase n=1 Tax=Corynebacterium sp. AOP12-C2-36 TaxID=3457723 RepID=UPI004033593F